MKQHRLLVAIIALVTFTGFGQTGLTIGTWNIEHLGSGGRGFPEYLGNNGFKSRTDDDLKKIAIFIRDTLSTEIICVQEIGSSEKKSGMSYSDELKKITDNLGKTWKYYLANFVDGDKSNNEMQNAFIYDESKVELKTVFEMSVPDFEVDSASVFDRKPLVGYFIKKGTQDDFVLVNVHLASSQGKYKAHLVAIVTTEGNLKRQLKEHGIEDQDIIILGDFNNDPFNSKNSTIVFDFMKGAKYTDLVNKSFGATRMNKKLTSIIDHVWLSAGAKKHVKQNKATMFRLKI
ncbi:hypothetical protein [Fluviicola sp.]|uniref:hypothetical protein n=1 Tax=Fluviicola sp. TaxID=1917219 RepID=UPI003D2CB82B